MTDTIAAGDGALRRGAEAVHGAHGDITAGIRRVQNQLDDLAGVWTGDAATSYARMLATWNADATRLGNVLTELEDALRGTERDLVAVEQSHRDAITGLRSLMGES